VTKRAGFRWTKEGPNDDELRTRKLTIMSDSGVEQCLHQQNDRVCAQHISYLALSAGWSWVIVNEILIRFTSCSPSNSGLRVGSGTQQL